MAYVRIIMLMASACLVYGNQHFLTSSCSISCPKELPHKNEKCNCDDEIQKLRTAIQRLSEFSLGMWNKASNDRWYRFYREKVQFLKAQEICKNAGGKLISSGWRQPSARREIINLVGLSGEEVWMGLTDRAEEGVWIWNDGVSGHDANWLPGEPNNHKNNEDCAYSLGSGNYNLNDTPCDDSKFVLCETKEIQI